jgi:AraC-like DNA-binding protein
MPANSAREGYRFYRPAQCDDLEVVRGTRIQSAIDSHLHGKYEIGLVEQGAAILSVRGEALELTEGSMFVVNPCDVHEAGSTTGCSFALLYITPERMVRAACDAGLDDAAPVFAARAFSDPIVARLLRQVHDALEREAPRSEVEALLEAMLAMLVTRVQRIDEQVASSRSQEAVERVRLFIEDHYAEPITLDELAAVAALSKYHLIRVFRAAFGMPPHAFQNAVRVARAREALAQGQQACEVAQATGFADQSHFTRRFKKLVGVAPGEYARASNGRTRRVS